MIGQGVPIRRERSGRCGPHPTGREFGLRAHGQDLALPNRTREVLQALTVAVTPPPAGA